jgi:hypothetical protein
MYHDIRLYVNVVGRVAAPSASLRPLQLESSCLAHWFTVRKFCRIRVNSAENLACAGAFILT